LGVIERFTLLAALGAATPCFRLS